MSKIYGRRDIRMAPWHVLKRKIAPFVYFSALITLKSRRAHFGTLFMSSTEGDFFERSFTEFAATSFGPQLLQNRPDVAAILSDRHRLAACPPHSLGRHYLEFMQSHGLDEAFYRTDALNALVQSAKGVQRAWYRKRIGNHHDLYHVLSGYGPDDLGEASLLAFRFGQTRHKGTLCISVGMAILKGLRPGFVACLIEAYRRGARAVSLEMLPWELCLDIPLETVRAWLGIMPAARCPSETVYAPTAYVDPHRAMTPARRDDASAWPPLSIGSSMELKAG